MDLSRTSKLLTVDTERRAGIREDRKEIFILSELSSKITKMYLHIT
jgi:hypothetical protein